MTTRWLALGLSVLALGLVAAGCGDDDEDDGGDGAATTEQTAPAETQDDPADEAPADDGAEPRGGAVSLSAPEDGSLEFNDTSLTADAGAVTIEFDNPSSVPHNVTLEGPDAATETITEGTTSVTTELEPGEYTFFCSVGGHRQAGMEGTLTVE